ncbi:MAG: DUF2625 family protein [Planctomycetota bacterium]
MRSLDELVRPHASAINDIRQWIDAAANECTILPPSEARGRALLAVQVPTDSTLGAIAYETGGILVDRGWLRYLGGGHSRLSRNLAGWNADRGENLYLVADDAVGGFFAIDGGAFGTDRDMYYWAPDRLAWEPIGFEFDFFFRWSLSSALDDFYQHLRWPNWASDVAVHLSPDQCFGFEPPLWAEPGSVTSRKRHVLSAAELYDLKLAARKRAES